MREKTFPARDAVAPIVRSLSNELGELVHMSLLQGGMLSPLYHYDVGAHGVHVHYDEGEMLPLHATASGIAVLAYSAPDFVQEFLGKPLPQITPKTPTNTEDLLGMIKRVHSQGYGEVSKTFDKDVASFAVPIFDSEQRVIGALAVAIPAARSNREKKREIVAALKRAGNAVTQAFGGITPSNVERLTA